MKERRSYGRKDDVNNARNSKNYRNWISKIETYIKIGVKHLVIKEKLPEWFDKHKGEEL